MNGSEVFKIDRLQRVHRDGIVVRMYQVVGATLSGWDSNRDAPVPDGHFYASLEAARDAGDERMLAAGGSRYHWRPL